MAQDVQIIDIRRSYVPLDPNAFPVTMLDAGGEDSPETRVPVVPYDGHNFMPTPQGYSSFFGLNVSIGIASLQASGGTGHVDDLFVIQTLTLDNIIVALCDDGLWVKSGSIAGNWTHTITLPVPPLGTHLQWSKCVLENEVICYRQGDTGHYKATPANGYIFTLEIPTFLNMAGQLGIFKAGGRLAYWDSENSIGWSELGFTQNFIPDLETLAGNTIFQDIVGKIVVCLSHGTGFIVYCTKSIVAVSRNVGSPMLWQGKALFNGNGLSYREEVCVSEPDVTHFAFTTQGIAQISGQVTQSGSSVANGEFISPEIATYLKEKRQPVYLKLLNGRYLFFSFLDPYYAVGNIAFNVEEIPENRYTFGGAVTVIDGYTPQTGSASDAMLATEETFDSYWIKKNLGKDRYQDANVPGSVPIWENHLSYLVPKAQIDQFKNTIATFFNSQPFNTGGLPKTPSGTEYFLPFSNPPLVAGFAPIPFVETNNHDLWNNQDFIWMYERTFMDWWIDAIKSKYHPDFDDMFVNSQANPFSADHRLERFGPYLDMSYFSESNKWYDSADKSAWVQRSLTKGIIIEVESEVLVSSTLIGNVNSDAEMALAMTGGNPVFPLGAPFDQQSNTLHSLLQSMDTLNVLPPVNNNPSQLPPFTLYHGWMLFSAIGACPGGTAGTTWGYFQINSGTGNAVSPSLGQFLMCGGNIVAAASRASLPPGYPKSVYRHTVKQHFATPRFINVEFPTCTYKEMAYTKIKGHGHYTILNNFLEDNQTGEAPDFVDICISDPDIKKKKLPTYAGGVIPGSPGNPGYPGFGAPTVIGGVPYQMPTQVITFPAGSILLQKGSIEPIYPTFLGAFVFDIHYKKWGKYVGNFKRLLDYFPVNNVAGDGIVPYDIFLPRGAILHEDGLIYLFDQFPSDSFITYGKVGFYRKGFTQSEEIRIVNRSKMTGNVMIEASITSGDINPSLGISRPFTDTKEFVAYAAASARWYNVIVEGNYDLMHLEFRGHRTGRR